MALTELDRLKYRTISFKDIVTGGWVPKVSSNPTYFLGPTLVGPRESERSEDERYRESAWTQQWTQIGLIGFRLLFHGRTKKIDAESCICYDSARKAVVFCGG